jgi:DNA-directed RNA polymerase specialized sigma24 family protein
LNRFQDVNLDRLYKVLSLRAMGIVRYYGGPETFDVGFEYKDVLHEVFKDFFDSPDALGWRESKGPIEAYLGKVLHNRIVDHLRRQKHVAGSIDDENRSPSVQVGQKGVYGRPPERAKVDTKSKLYELVEDDAALKDLIAAAELTSGSHNVNQEIGETLDNPPSGIKA